MAHRDNLPSPVKPCDVGNRAHLLLGANMEYADGRVVTERVKARPDIFEGSPGP